MKSMVKKAVDRVRSGQYPQATGYTDHRCVTKFSVFIYIDIVCCL